MASQRVERWHEPATDRVQVDVAQQHPEVSIVLHQDRAKAIMEEIAPAPMP
jgi:hypothetical protein